VGDALGAPLEFQPARAPEHYVREMIGGGWQRLAPGEWTDDTQMSLDLVESLLHKRVFDPDDIARRFVHWKQSGPKDIGLHTSRVLEEIREGMPWEQASLSVQRDNPDNAPNGSLMRCAPLALFLYHHPEYVTELSRLLSRITHAHSDCEWACVFQNAAILNLLHGQSKQDAIQAAYETCDEATPELKERIGLAMHPHNTTSPSGWVLDTLEVAVWCFLNTHDFEDAVVQAINRGDDADTVGAVVGALAGARYGASGIPERWLLALKDAPLLLQHADSLLELALSF
jgi:ADP-ribosyl-[dinitrogen reductase] hydrolase